MGNPGILGCMEHSVVVSQLLKEAKANNGNLAILWLYFKNAFVSIPHKILEVTLKRYHIPD